MKVAWCALIFLLVPIKGYCEIAANDITVIRSVTATNLVVVGEVSNPAADFYQLTVSKVIYDRDLFNVNKGDTIRLYEDGGQANGQTSDDVRKYIGKPVIVELTCLYDDNKKFGCYLSDFGGRGISRDISGDIERWQDGLQQVSSWASKLNSIAPHDIIMEEKVLRLVIELEYPHTGQTAADQLIAIGQDAVPYIVRYMKDFRVYPGRGLTLQNPERSFEKTRHYSPDLVIDVLSSVLGQITGHSFGYIDNGTPYPTERMAVLDAWRAYAYLWLKERKEAN